MLVEWGIGIGMWSGFYLFYNESPKYAREMHGIIHSVTGGKLTFSLGLQLSFLLSVHISKTKKRLPLSGFLISQGWLEEGLFLFGEVV